MALLIGAVVSACSADTDDSTRTPEETPVPPDGSDPPSLQDPPLEFASTPIEIPSTITRVHGSVVYYLRSEGDRIVRHDNPPREQDLASISVVAQNLATGEQLWSMPADANATTTWSRPLVAEVEGQPVVFTAQGIHTPGVGTSAGSDRLRVVALDAGTGNEIWRQELEADQVDLADERFLEPTETFPPRLLTADNKNLVIAAQPIGSLEGFSRQGRYAIIVDTATGDVRWAATGFEPAAIQGGSVVGVGIDSQSDTWLESRSAADGSTQWRAMEQQSPRPRAIRGLGEGHIALHSSPPSSRTFVVQQDRTILELDGRYTCWHDQHTTIVCDGGGHVVAHDQSTGQLLWELPDDEAGRVAPTIDTVHNGKAYAHTTQGPVILDTTSGQDEVTDLTVTVTSVVPGYGLVTPNGLSAGLEIYTATA